MEEQGALGAELAVATGEDGGVRLPVPADDAHPTRHVEKPLPRLEVALLLSEA